MMELLEWSQQLNAHALSLKELSLESSLFFAYVAIGLIFRKPVLPLAFLMCYLLVNATGFQAITETNMYLLTALIYSYVFKACGTIQNKIGCVIILLISMSFAVDARLYGVNGYYGEQQSYIWENIEYIALCAHTIFIGSFISISRILNSLRNTVDSISRLSVNSDYLMVYWYNVSTTHKK